MLTAALLMLIVVIPVFFLLFYFAWRYRDVEGNHSRYTPNWEHNTLEEFIWWAVPFAIVGVLAVITWSSSHALDPYQPLAATSTPIVINVVALDWKWLFIYPEQHIATVNYLEIPAGVPIEFHLTADAPMNSLWIPKLSGQIMAMPGMTTELHMEADHSGTFEGLSGNFSGDGFSGMHFPVQAVTLQNFKTWVGLMQESKKTLDSKTYEQLVAPSSDNPPAFYSSVDPGIFTAILDKYIEPPSRSLQAMMM
jgi:cytochrome o ubiquinol oxidase subunit II